MTYRVDAVAAAGPFTATPHGVEWRRGDHLVSTDTELLDFKATARFLAGTYWAAGISEQTVRRSVEQSIAYGLYEEAAGGIKEAAAGVLEGVEVSAGGNANRGQVQIGFARVVTDRVTFAWVGDVFVVESCRGRGLGMWLMQCVLAHPDLQDLRRWLLASTTARGLYASLGFTDLAAPERFMEIHDPGVHARMR